MTRPLAEEIAEVLRLHVKIESGDPIWTMDELRFVTGAAPRLARALQRLTGQQMRERVRAILDGTNFLAFGSGEVAADAVLALIQQVASKEPTP